jgi:hypothetical protein
LGRICLISAITSAPTRTTQSGSACRGTFRAASLANIAKPDQLDATAAILLNALDARHG